MQFSDINTPKTWLKVLEKALYSLETMQSLAIYDALIIFEQNHNAKVTHNILTAHEKASLQHFPLYAHVLPCQATACVPYCVTRDVPHLRHE